MIFVIRGQRVMIDRDLAWLYKVPTKALNQAVKRNMRRFPEDFMFRLSDEETIELVTNCDRLRNLKHSSSNPCAFTIATLSVGQQIHPSQSLPSPLASYKQRTMKTKNKVDDQADGRKRKSVLELFSGTLCLLSCEQRGLSRPNIFED